MWILEASKKTTYWHTPKHTNTQSNRGHKNMTQMVFFDSWFLNMVLNEMWVSSTINERKKIKCQITCIFFNKTTGFNLMQTSKKKSKSFVTVTTISTSLQSISYFVTMISKHQICAFKKKLYQFLTMKPYLHSSLVYFTQMESVTANCAHISNAEKKSK